MERWVHSAYECRQLRQGNRFRAQLDRLMGGFVPGLLRTQTGQGLPRAAAELPPAGAEIFRHAQPGSTGGYRRASAITATRNGCGKL